MPRATVELPTLEAVKTQLRQALNTPIQRHYKLLTPLYGGGVRAGENDLNLLIRPTSIRGHLRFWWRAARASNEHIKKLIADFRLQDLQYKRDKNGKIEREFTDIEKLRLVEGWIWGAAAEEQEELSKLETINNLSKSEIATKRLAQSRVQVEVTDISTENANRLKVFKGFWEYKFDDDPKKSKWLWKTKCLIEPSYLYFPMRPEEDETTKPEHDGNDGDKWGEIPHGSVWSGVEFQIKIYFLKSESIQEEVEAALWAWEVFGGIGARTRRGFGAISDTRKPTTKFSDWFEQAFNTHVKIGLSVNEIPRIPDKSQIVFPKSNWEYAINKYQQFRQQRGRGNGQRPGRSKWTEADAIRQITGSSHFRHRDPLDEHKDANGKAIEVFPRAVLGLPIIFQFIGAPTPTITLEGRQHERLASPIIIRPFHYGDFQGVVVIALSTPLIPPNGLKLKEIPTQHVAYEIHSGQEATVPLNGEIDVIQALLKELK